ncbi:MAG TPA: hypothetical protein DEB31_05915 [Clostridiales bacterium]|nr:hypothetical protein [Clostridiales bacterium]
MIIGMGNVTGLMPTANPVNLAAGNSGQADVETDFASAMDEAAKAGPKSDGQNDKGGGKDALGVSDADQPDTVVEVVDDKPKQEEPEPEVIVVLHSVPMAIQPEQAAAQLDNIATAVEAVAQDGQVLPEAGAQAAAEGQTANAFAEVLETVGGDATQQPLQGQAELPQGLTEQLPLAAQSGPLQADAGLMEPAMEPAQQLVPEQQQLEQTEQPQQTEQAPVLDLAEGLPKDTLDFVKQAMSEAETMLAQPEAQQAVAEPAAEPAQAEPLMQSMEPAETTQQESSMTQSEDGDADMGEKKSAAPQPQTANIAPDGKVEFKLASVSETVEQPVPVKETVASQIIDQVKTMVSGEKQEIVLQLKPAHLGGLTIMLASEGGKMVAKLVTASKEAHLAIQAEMQAMQQELRDRGINVVEMEVIYGQMADSANTQRDSEGGQAQGGGTRRRAYGRVTENMDALTMMYDDLSTYEVLAEHGGSVEFSA